MEHIVQPLWKGESCVILGGGPSLRTMNWEAINDSKTRIITINEAWKLAPTALHYFADFDWWQRQQARNPIATDSQGRPYSFHDLIYKGVWFTSAPQFLTHPQVHYLKVTGERGLETSRAGLRHGSNSGYQAINLAYHLGVKKIVLLGYDMKVQQERTHWHNDGTIPASTFSMMLEKSFLPHFESLAQPLSEAGVEVVNATPDSALQVWPYQPLEEALGLVNKA